MTETRYLPFHLPLLGEEEIDEVTSVLRSGWLTTGPRVHAFEIEFSKIVGAPALAVSSGTAAMHLGLLSAGIGPGDVVITTPYTFCSTVHVIEHVGARPVLVDVEPDTLNIDPARVEATLGSVADGRVRALLPVHFAGHPCEMDQLFELARARDLTVVEDAAHALGAAYRGRQVGCVHPELTHSVAFSFYATKAITTGEGGMLTAAEPTLDEARLWTLHGINRDAWRRHGAGGSWYYEVVRPGFKYNMMDLQAALGTAQLRRADAMLRRRTEIATAYTAAFREMSELEVPTSRPEVTHAWHLYSLRLNLDQISVSRAGFITKLAEAGIGTSVHFIPVHLHPYYRDRYGFRPQDFPVANREYERIVSLPIYPRMTDDDVGRVVTSVRDIVARCRRP